MMITLDSEQKNKLEIYATLLQKWQKSINLVSSKTIEDLWTRHFEDSLQLSPLLESGKGLDIGSGAGFPALPLAIIRPDLNFTCIESDERKCIFMETVSRETKLNNVQIKSERIERFMLEADLKSYDFVTARALASINNICELVYPVFEANSKCKAVLLKGRRAAEEVDEALQKWRFKKSIKKSATDSEAMIICLSDLQRK